MSWRRREGERRGRRPTADEAITQEAPAMTDEEILRVDPEGVFSGRRDGEQA